MELPRTAARTAPLANLLAIGRVLDDARIGVSIADENPAFLRERNTGCSEKSSAESADRWFRQPAHVNLKQLFALRTELDDGRGSRVDGPDIALRVEPDRVWNLVQAFTKRGHEAAFLCNRYDWIRFVTPLNEPGHTSLCVARQPRNHAQFLVLW